MVLPDRLHPRYVRASWPIWFPGLGEAEARETLFRQAEVLRRWYDGRMSREDPPYRDAALGYVAAYMPRGYFWLQTVLQQQRKYLGPVFSSARSVLVLGCGPAPELWALSRYLKPGVAVTLADEAMDVWKPLISEFTVPLVGESLESRRRAAEPLRLCFRDWTHQSVEGRFDLIVGQQVVNEVNARLSAARRQGSVPWDARETVRFWRSRNLLPAGAIVIVDLKKDRLQDIGNGLPRAAWVVGEIRPYHGYDPFEGCDTDEFARDVANWLSGPWGRCKARTNTDREYLVTCS